MKVFIVALILPAVALGQLITGGITDTTVSTTYEPVVFAVDAINNHLAASNGGKSPSLALVDIVKARTQVVAGQNLFLTLHLTGDYFCDVTVWYRAWLTGSDRMQVTDGPTCSKHQPVAARILAGGIGQPKPVSGLTDLGVKGALDFAVCATNARVNDMFASVLGDLSGATYTAQVTAGMTYRFSNVQLVQSGCRNQGCDAVDLSSCTPTNGGMTKSCDFTVQFQAWMTPQYTLTSINC